MAAKKQEDVFEDLIRQAEEAVEMLESGDLPLEEAMKKYELGVKNLKKCSALIEQAQKKVEKVIAEREGELELGELDPDELEEDED